uniref:Uncharacterized protein n=1 Tax=Globisporangium ultimum (strain ATCC 200006 / CBS 805.95 / DAOM BR144) TaxID=431595 RepID=K3WWG8_GLOUD
MAQRVQMWVLRGESQGRTSCEEQVNDGRRKR